MQTNKKNKDESIWQNMLESLLTQSKEKVGNLLWCGSPKTGKKKLITSIQILAKHNKPKILEDKFSSLEKVYIMDFKYLKIVNRKDDSTEEASKLNFYIMNKQYEYMKEFLTIEILTNLLVVVVVDLNNPKTIAEDIGKWVSFLRSSISDYLSSLNEDRQKTIRKGFQESKLRIRQMTSLVALQEDFRASLATNNPDNPINMQESLGLSHVEDDEIDLPLLLVANKSDCLDNINDETLRDKIQYDLRDQALKNEALLISTSSHSNRNLDLLYKVLGGVLVNFNEQDDSVFEPKYNITNMFIPLGVDDPGHLETQLGKAKDYEFKEETAVEVKEDGDEKEKKDIKLINDFLSEIQNGVFSYQQERSTNQRGGDYNSRLNNSSSRFMNDSNRFLGESRRLLESNRFMQGSNRNTERNNNKAETLDRIKSILGKK